jgi:hypothetical protein
MTLFIFTPDEIEMHSPLARVLIARVFSAAVDGIGIDRSGCPILAHTRAVAPRSDRRFKDQLLPICVGCRYWSLGQ